MGLVLEHKTKAEIIQVTYDERCMSYVLHYAFKDPISREIFVHHGELGGRYFDPQRHDPLNEIRPIVNQWLDNNQQRRIAEKQKNDRILIQWLRLEDVLKFFLTKRLDEGYTVEESLNRVYKKIFDK